LLRAEGIDLLAIAARRLESLSDFETAVPKVSLGSRLEAADVYVLAVADHAIIPVMQHYGGSNALFVHTSGAMGLEVLEPAGRKGVMYPLQTFSRHREISFESIPICIETALESDAVLLSGLAGALSHEVHEISTEKRRSLHLAAVYINNFSNHMVYLGEELCKKAGLSGKLLQPLLNETCAKLGDLSAYEAQTGPARRKDTRTQQEHLKILREVPEKELYKIISESIKRTYDQEL
jgi:predicted short-subunit dehydrogenase-like oxidoreductase (DUF2520 family)